MNGLRGKHALITDGTTGIGLETARLLAREGARVAITGTNPVTLAQAREDLGEGVLALSSDAGDLSAQKRLSDAVATAFGTLDILCVNAGIVDLRPLDQWDEAGWDRSFSINLKGPFFLVQALLPVFANPASIVLTASVNAHIGMAGSAVYAATKAGLLSLARTLSGELIPRGIRVNAVSPGPVATPLYGKLGLSEGDLKATAEALRNQVPARRFGEASEIAAAIAFLASADSAFTVGSELVIDGGMINL